jgi:hypothetical protein
VLPVQILFNFGLGQGFLGVPVVFHLVGVREVPQDCDGLYDVGPVVLNGRNRLKWVDLGVFVRFVLQLGKIEKKTE